MRHRKSGRHLNRTSAHRRALMRNLSISLFEHEVIKTTLPKAKELRRVAEPLITLAKKDTVANRRIAFNRLRNKAAVGKLFSELGPRFKDRPGGYSRVLKMGFRTGDSAPMALVELVEREFSGDTGATGEADTVVGSSESEAQPTRLVADLEEVPPEAQEEQLASVEEEDAAVEDQASDASEDEVASKEKTKEDS